MLFLFLVSAVSSAQEAAHYNTTEIARRSALFTRASETSAPLYQEAETNVRRFSGARDDLRIATLVLGNRLNADAVQQNLRLRAQIWSSYEAIAIHTETLQTDYDLAFSNAVNRALETESFDSYRIVECQVSTVATMTGRSNCEGTDISESLSEWIDRDEELAAAVEEITNREWPSWNIDIARREAIPLNPSNTGEALMVDVASLADHYLGERISVWGQGELSAEEINAEGEALLVAIDEALQRAAPRGEDPRGLTLCFNPEVLGGCGGEDGTLDLDGLISDDRRFSRAVEGIGN